MLYTLEYGDDNIELVVSHYLTSILKWLCYDYLEFINGFKNPVFLYNELNPILINLILMYCWAKHYIFYD